MLHDASLLRINIDRLRFMQSTGATLAANEPSPEKIQGIPRYVAATRPPFLIASILPVFIGIAAAWYSSTSFNWFTGLLTLIGAILAHAGINVLNDYYDHLNGTDEQNTVGESIPFLLLNMLKPLLSLVRTPLILFLL